MSYRLKDARRLAERIKAMLPEAEVQRWRDYGWSVDVKLWDRACVACQPRRTETGQREIYRTASQVVWMLTGVQ